MNKLKFFFGNNTDKELTELGLLLTKVFKIKFELNYLKWLYQDNPYGKAITFNISKNRKIVGHYAVIPSEIYINNKLYKAALSLNTAVDDDFKGKGFFKIMAKKTFEKFKKKNIRFIFGVSNYQSTKLFVKKFNFQNFGELNVMFGIGNIIQNSNKKKFKVNWNKKSLNWRLKNPKVKYTVNHNKNKLTINSELYKIINIYMGEFKKDISLKIKKENNRFKLLNLYIGLGNNLSNLFYINLPKILKPSPLNFILKDLSTKNHNLKLERKHIFFQLLDFDVF